MGREALHLAPARRGEAKEGDRRVHRVFADVLDWFAREIMRCERHAESACAHSRLSDERGALDGTLCGSCLVGGREAWYLQRVRGDGLT